MKKVITIIASIIALSLIATGIATAFNPNAQDMPHYEEMQQILENGTYEDLTLFREENSGLGGPRWVTDKETFSLWQERHEDVQENDYTPQSQQHRMGNKGNMQGQGHRNYENCPMWN